MRFTKEARARRSAEEQAAEELSERRKLVDVFNGGVQKAVEEMKSHPRQTSVELGPVAGFNVIYQKRPHEPATFFATRPVSYATEGRTIADVNLQFAFVPGQNLEGKPAIIRQTSVGEETSGTVIGEKILNLAEMEDLVAVTTALPMKAKRLNELTDLSKHHREALGREIDQIRTQRYQDIIESSRLL